MASELAKDAARTDQSNLNYMDQSYIGEEHNERKPRPLTVLLVFPSLFKSERDVVLGAA